MVDINKWEFITPGIPDIYFAQDNNPNMTKEEVRCLTLCKVRLKIDSVVYDIGAGIGTIAIEAALLAKEGLVFAVEKNPPAAAIILKNAKKFGVNNLRLIRGEAPEALAELPLADRIIIGGSGGRVKEVLSAAQAKLKPQGRVIVNAITVETLATAVKQFAAMGLDEVNTCCLNITRVKQAGRAKIFKGMNPVFLIVGESRGK
ncbi:hypothetical protein DK28_0200655 [Peptococcaceae bacterium SCADC1_2_3]|nr:hypothetical protein DK28_0200655 [Peptococcaceae bacterium SCADC1_2_3]